MPIFRSQMGTSRGEAGEGYGQSKNYNFTNLYQMNRDKNGLQNKANALGARVAGIGETEGSKLTAGMDDNAPIKTADMATQVARAKDISNETQGFSVEGDAMKRGNSAYQSGVLGFYEGANNPAIKQIQGYNNIYASMLAQQRAANVGTDAGAPVPPRRHVVGAANSGHPVGAGGGAIKGDRSIETTGREHTPGVYVPDTGVAGGPVGVDSGEHGRWGGSSGGFNDGPGVAASGNEAADLLAGLNNGSLTQREYDNAIRGGPNSTAWMHAMRKIQQEAANAAGG